MSDEGAVMEFPPGPRYYSVVQTSPFWRAIVIGSLLVGSIIVSLSFGSAYLNGPRAIGLGGILAFVAAIAALIGLAFALWFARPFSIKDGVVYLMGSVRLHSGRRTRLISLSEISDVSLVENIHDKLQIWVTLSDGTRFHMVTMADEEGKDFARRFADHFQG